MIAPDTLLQNRYLVRERIGQGGMGAVYIATDQRFGSTVALKETFFDDPSLRRAFEREARLLNHLRHHALPRVSDHFSEDEGQFLVMEYIPGDDLSDMLHKRGAAFPLRDVLAWADQLLDALDYLHTQEPPVIHRDIKPQNLKLTARNQIVLLDFGLAKGTPLQTRVTGTGSVFGYSRNYAPLEQMQGTGTDPRSDLYSLAATLYHLTTGVTPPDALTRATAVLNGLPDPLRPADEVHAQIPRAVAEVLSRSMSQSAAARPQTAEEMRAALREAGQNAAGTSAATSAATRAAAAAPATNIQDQETQLLGATRAGARTTDAGAPGDTARAAGALGASTVINSPTLPSDRTAAAAVAGINAAPDTASADAGATSAAPDSLVTRVPPAHADATPPPRRGFPVRTLGALASVLLLVAVAGAYLAFTRNPAASSSPPPPAPLPVVSEQSPPPAEAAPDSKPQQTPAPVVSTTQPVVETAQPVAPVPAPPTQARPPQQQSPAPAQKSAKDAGRKPAREEDEDERENAEDSDAPEPPDVRAPLSPDPNVDWTNPVQRQRALRRMRRAVREQQRVIEQQRQTEERRRRRPLLYPPPR